MGTGKTCTISRVIDKRGARRGIIAGPASLRDNFINEYRKFGRQNLRWCKGNNIHDYVAWKRGAFDMLVTSYELMTKWWPDFKRDPEMLDIVIFDEAHYLKSIDASRTKAALGIGACMEDCWCEWTWSAYWLTGTPIPNDPQDIYTFLRFVGAMPLSENQFKKRYFYVRSTAFGTKCEVRPEMLDEIQALVSNNSIRRTLAEVGHQLPPIFLTQTLVDGDAAPVLALLRSHPELEAAILAAVEAGGLSFLDAQYVATLRRLIGESKAVPYAHLLAEELKWSGAKRIIFGIHIEALKYIHAFLQRQGLNGVLSVGPTPDAEKRNNVIRFQEDKECQYYLANMKVGGIGATLTAACAVDMFESAWTPAENAQALKRAHRIGQENTVRARFIVLSGTLDETVTKVVAAKTAAIAAVEGSAMIAAPSP